MKIRNVINKVLNSFDKIGSIVNTDKKLPDNWEKIKMDFKGEFDLGMGTRIDNNEQVEVTDVVLEWFEERITGKKNSDETT